MGTPVAVFYKPSGKVSDIIYGLVQSHFHGVI